MNRCLPPCLLCGSLFPVTRDSPRHYPPTDTSSSEQQDQALREGPLKKYWKFKPKHVIVPSTEVEESYVSKNPGLWSCFCRLIIKESDTKYRLTGINKVETRGIDDRIYSLNDPAMARVGGEKHARHYSRDFTLVCAADIRKWPCEYGKKLIGYVVHAHCWMVFCGVIGLTPSEINLAKFVRASLEHCHDKENWGLLDMIADWPPCPVQSGLSYSREGHRRPFILPAVQNAIYSARFMCQRPYPCFDKVPFDVVFLIAESVCPTNYTTSDVDDTRNMIFAFQWKLPDLFWSARLNENEFFEFEVLKKDMSPVDWQMLRLDMMALVSDSLLYARSGLSDRKWLLETMLAIKGAYLEQV